MSLLTRRLMTIVCAAGLMIAVSGCGAGGGGDPLVSVLERAAAADSSFGVRYSFRGRLTDNEGTTRVHGYGQAEADQRRDRTVLVDRNTRGEIISDGQDEYSGGSVSLAGLLESSSRKVRWSKLDLSRLLDAGYVDRLCGAQLPAKVASALAMSDPTIQKLSPARVGGRRTLRYRVTTTYGRVIDALAGEHDASQCDQHDRAAKFTA